VEKEASGYATVDYRNPTRKERKDRGSGHSPHGSTNRHQMKAEHTLTVVRTAHYSAPERDEEEEG